jgi:hypothetical protein
VGYRKPYIEKGVGSKWDAKNLTGSIEKWTTNQSIISIWLRKRANEKF